MNAYVSIKSESKVRVVAGKKDQTHLDIETEYIENAVSRN